MVRFVHSDSSSLDMPLTSEYMGMVPLGPMRLERSLRCKMCIYFRPQEDKIYSRHCNLFDKTVLPPAQCTLPYSHIFPLR